MNAPNRNFVAQDAKRCEHCGGAYHVKPSKAATSRFCSMPCKVASQITLPEAQPRPCKACGKSFTPRRKNPERRFCSKGCVMALARSTRTPEQHREYGRRSGDAQRGKGEGKSYRKLYGQHEHRVIAERMLGRPLRRGEVVHHRDHNKLNNGPENLEVLTQREHMLEHGLGVPGKPLTWEPWKYRGRKNRERTA